MVHGTSYNVITTVNKNEYIRVFAGVGEWYIVQTDSDYVGAVSRKYVRAIYPSSSGSSIVEQEEVAHLEILQVAQKRRI